MIYRIVVDGVDIMNLYDRRYMLLSPELETEVNAAGSLKFTLPPTHPLYDSIQPLTSTVEVYEDEDIIWFGRPVDYDTDYLKQRVWYCEGALSWLIDSNQLLHEYDTISLHTFFETVISNHNSQMTSDDRKFVVGRITVTDETVYRKLNYRDTYDCLRVQCLNAKGGYLFTRREGGVNYIDWLAEMPYTTNQPVEFGLNLLDLKTRFEGSAIVTAVLPLGEKDEETGEQLTVASINHGSPIIDSDAVATYGRITKKEEFSGVVNVETLYADGLEYLQSKQFDDLTIECTAAELHRQNPNYDRFRLGQMVHVCSNPHLVDKNLPIAKLSMRLDTAAKQITLGTQAKQTLTKITKEGATEGVQDALDAGLDEIWSELESIGDLFDELSTSDLEDLVADWHVFDEINDTFTSLATDDLTDLTSDWHVFDEINSAISDYGDAFGDYDTDDGTVAGRFDSIESALGDYDSTSGDIESRLEPLENSTSVGSWIIQVDGVAQTTGTINFVTQ